MLTEGLLYVFNARCYTSTVYAITVCPSISPSQVGFVLKWLDIQLQYVWCGKN